MIMEKNWLKRTSWPPLIGGAVLGALIMISFLVASRPLGASRAYISCAAIIENVFSPEHVSNTLYFTRYGPEFEWTIMVVLGIVAGAFASSRLSGDFKVSYLSPEWRARFGESRRLKSVFALTGGILLGFGARLAGGCTSGQALSGTLQLAVSGLVFFAMFFAGGVVIARALYGRKP
jgi:hypothetical protein